MSDDYASEPAARSSVTNVGPTTHSARALWGPSLRNTDSSPSCRNAYHSTVPWYTSLCCITARSETCWHVTTQAHGLVATVHRVSSCCKPGACATYWPRRRCHVAHARVEAWCVNVGPAVLDAVIVFGKRCWHMFVLNGCGCSMHGRCSLVAGVLLRPSLLEPRGQCFLVWRAVLHPARQ